MRVKGRACSACTRGQGVTRRGLILDIDVMRVMNTRAISGTHLGARPAVQLGDPRARAYVLHALPADASSIAVTVMIEETLSNVDGYAEGQENNLPCCSLGAQAGDWMLHI